MKKTVVGSQKPNYRAIYHTYGGHLKDYTKKQQATRFFPGGPRKRMVTATITSYVGYGDPRACHYYVRLEEEHNHFWDGECWRQCWDERDNGLEIERRTKSRAVAARLPREMFKEHFSPETHRLVTSGYADILDRLKGVDVIGD
jgi:hypothetical protein